MKDESRSRSFFVYGEQDSDAEDFPGKVYKILQAAWINHVTEIVAASQISTNFQF